jgi:hypothetical protein
MAFSEGGLGETSQQPRGFSRVARCQPSDIERKHGQAKRRLCEETSKSGFPQKYQPRFTAANPPVQTGGRTGGS